MQVFTADKVFTGFDWLPDHAIVTQNGRIEDLLPIVSLSPNLVITNHSYMIIPAFIDIQIYGADGKLFATSPTKETLRAMYNHCISGGTNNFLPTIATNSLEVVKKAINAIKNYWGDDGKGVVGLHMEGPWINKIKKGAHEEDFIHAPSLTEVMEIIGYGDGVIKMITLAPECCPDDIIAFIRSKEIVISIGHSNASFTEATQAFNNGIYLATHLFNAMSPFHHRDPGIPGAVIQHPQVMASIVADGYHVNFEVINIVKRLMRQRLFLITDAVTETSTGLYQHKYEGDKYTHHETLSGSSLSMLKAATNCIKKAGISEQEALRMASHYPAKVLGLDYRLGLIKKGYDAELTFLDSEWLISNHPI